MHKFTKVEAGWYATEDGRWAIVSDGYGYVDADGRAEGFANDGWALAFSPDGRLREDHNDGENVGWFDTKREALIAASLEMAR